ncbi:hypothetical protein H7H82_13360 [Mycobacterium heidelbergense]|uniref:hypothetical protein n=1 Tax=Mycobacterium heidelbergense TaxID=53376 RepID=UPI0011541FCC|nr:hypothetical protein [Mycobacterium heidelbergense]MCV7051567.1 hypothetical protein [Mycobacterium heidelbergense]
MLNLQASPPLPPIDFGAKRTAGFRRITNSVGTLAEIRIFPHVLTQPIDRNIQVSADVYSTLSDA